MLFPHPLQRGKLIKRYKRFLADILLDTGETITAHCPNSGALLGLTTPGVPVWVSPEANPQRVLAFTWQMAETEGTYVGTNTQWPNELVDEGLKTGCIAPLASYRHWQREVKVDPHTRLDFRLIEGNLPPCFLEVKNVHLRRETHAQFPDCVTTRGTKHLRTLMTLHAQGNLSVLIYVIQRNDCLGFSLATDLDPVYAATAKEAKAAGVAFYAYTCDISPQGIVLAHSVPVHL